MSSPPFIIRGKPEQNLSYKSMLVQHGREPESNEYRAKTPLEWVTRSPLGGDLKSSRSTEVKADVSSW